MLLYIWNPVEIGSNGALLEPYCPGQKFVMTNLDLLSNAPNQLRESRIKSWYGEIYSSFY